MNEFAENLDTDLNDIKKKMAEHRQTADSYFTGLKSHLGDLGAEVRGAMAGMSNDITVRCSDFPSAALLTQLQGFVMAVKASLRNTEDLDRMLKRLFQTMAQGNAEMAAKQEQALDVATSYAKSHLVHLNDLAGETGETISDLRASVVSKKFQCVTLI